MNELDQIVASHHLDLSKIHTKDLCEEIQRLTIFLFDQDIIRDLVFLSQTITQSQDEETNIANWKNEGF
jgi:hypothetical protein